MSTEPGITAILHDLAAGDSSAIDRLLPFLYPELRRLAAYYMSGQPLNHTLQPTALVHEAYLKLTSQTSPSFKDRTHFLGVASVAMRHILVDHARSKRRAKRGDNLLMISLDSSNNLANAHPAAVQTLQSIDTLVLDEVLHRLATFDAEKARLLELRYFGGLTNEEIAEFTGVSLATVKRHISLAKAWLQRELTA